MDKKAIIFLLAALIFLAQCQSSELETAVTPVSPPTVTPIPAIGITLATKAPPTAVVQQTTPTPRPAPTTTPSPTPIIYLVAEGDTLLGIAIARDTTVEEIKALNPEVQPQLLQIGQALILPPPVVADYAGLVGTAVPVQVRVRQIQVYRTPVGAVWLLGEVVNDGDTPVDNVTLTLELPDAAGGPSATAVAWASAAIIPPGGVSPFGVLLAAPPAEWGAPLIAVSGGDAVVDLGSRYLDLAVGDTAVSAQSDRAEISGQVQNVGETAAQVIVVASLYDAQGNLAGFQQMTLPDVLLAGETRPFTMQAAPPGGTAVTVQVIAFGQRVASAAP